MIMPAINIPNLEVLTDPMGSKKCDSMAYNVNNNDSDNENRYQTYYNLNEASRGLVSVDSPTGRPRAARCGGCGNPISDRFYLRAVDREWHCHCLRCAHCGVGLESQLTCFSRHGLVYCKEDYYRLFSGWKNCARCQATIKPRELVMKVKVDLYYHVECFSCSTCNQTFQKGDFFGLFDDRVYCRYHYKILTETQYHLLGGGYSPVNRLEEEEAAERSSGAKGKPTKGGRRGRKKVANFNKDLKSNLKSKLQLKENNSPTETRRDRLEASSALEADKSSESITTTLSNTITIESGDPASASATSEPSTSTSTSTTPTPAIVTDSTSSSDFKRLLPNPFGLHEDREGCGSSSSWSSSGSGTGFAPRRPKRMRTSFKHHQLRQMKAYFGINHNPDSKDLKQLSLKTGLSKRVLQVWFQNARAKWRRNLLRQQSLGPQIVEECKPLLELTRECHLITSQSQSQSQSHLIPQTHPHHSSPASFSPAPGLFIDPVAEPISPLAITQQEQNLSLFNHLF